MPDKRLRIAAAQIMFRRTIPENLEVIHRFIDDSSKAGCDVLLFPECALTGYQVDFREIKRPEIERGLKLIAEAARSSRINVLIGAPTFVRGRRFNSLVVFDRKGREKFRYNKTHLTPHDAEFFTRGNSLAFFHLDRVPC